MSHSLTIFRYLADIRNLFLYYQDLWTVDHVPVGHQMLVQTIQLCPSVLRFNSAASTYLLHMALRELEIKDFRVADNAVLRDGLRNDDIALFDKLEGGIA